MSTLFPELNERIVQYILRNGIRIREEATSQVAVLETLESLGVVITQTHKYVRCAYQEDFDYLDRPDLACDGRIEIGMGDTECPRCGAPISEIEQKRKLIEHEVLLNRTGIEQYLRKALSALDCIRSVQTAGPVAFEVSLQDGQLLNVVVPEYSDVRHHSAGLFFAEPTVYIIASPINQPTMTVIEECQYILLADLLSNSADSVEEDLQTAAIPIEGRRNLSDVERRFDEMMTRHIDRSWQFFERDFIPALVNHITEHPELVQDYLKKLRRLSSTIFGEFYVPIGGGGRTDLRPIDKLELMNAIFEGHSTGDAKYYPRSTVSYDHVGRVNFHLDRDPSKATKAIIYAATNDIAPTAWNAAMELRQRNGSWKIIILPKYLLLELIEAVHAVDLLTEL